VEILKHGEWRVERIYDKQKIYALSVFYSSKLSSVIKAKIRHIHLAKKCNVVFSVRIFYDFCMKI
jgi:hypothetical protein